MSAAPTVRRPVALLWLGWLAIVVCPGAARGGAAVTIAGLSGVTQFDPVLADYQWDVTPRPAFGLSASLESGSSATGLRVATASSRQDVGAADDAAVTVTTWELIGRHRLATLLGVEVAATASAGLLHLSYRPDQVEIATGAGGAPVTVELDAVNTWVAGGGLSFRRPLAGAWIAGLELEHRRFELETAHRSGDVIETSRESFGDWSARVELAHAWDIW